MNLEISCTYPDVKDALKSINGGLELEKVNPNLHITLKAAILPDMEKMAEIASKWGDMT